MVFRYFFRVSRPTKTLCIKEYLIMIINNNFRDSDDSTLSMKITGKSLRILVNENIKKNKRNFRILVNENIKKNKRNSQTNKHD